MSSNLKDLYKQLGYQKKKKRREKLTKILKTRKMIFLSRLRKQKMRKRHLKRNSRNRFDMLERKCRISQIMLIRESQKRRRRRLRNEKLLRKRRKWKSQKPNYRIREMNSKRRNPSLRNTRDLLNSWKKWLQIRMKKIENSMISSHLKIDSKI